MALWLHGYLLYMMTTNLQQDTFNSEEVTKRGWSSSLSVVVMHSLSVVQSFPFFFARCCIPAKQSSYEFQQNEQKLTDEQRHVNEPIDRSLWRWWVIRDYCSFILDPKRNRKAFLIALTLANEISQNQVARAVVSSGIAIGRCHKRCQLIVWRSAVWQKGNA
jgi:hypothetical protein